ncbi:MAG: NAD-dependent epimerase/dehydratase family protein [Flavobacteriaceae bacterium]|jgi:nucleoside-diphosphate-sugar epimerase|nr:NAD-dependent epimerase/dehydratase family protein [Flavobacteriaceae bacterium]
MILVTGGTGLVGAHLLLHLLQSQTDGVRAIFRKKESIKKTKHFFDINQATDLFQHIEWIEADIMDIPNLEIAFRNVTEVYHCAALVSFDPKDEIIMRKINIEGTANMVNLALDFKITKFCHVSSIAALGETLTKDKIIYETTDWNPELHHSDYAITKYGAEMEVWRGTQEGLNVIIVNPGVIFGQGFKNEGSDAIFQKIAKGFPFYTSGQVGIVSAKDVAKAMVLLMQSNIINERFTLVSDNITYKELFDSIATLLQQKKPYLCISKSFLYSICYLDALITLITPKKRSLTPSIVQASYSKYIYDNNKIKQSISFDFIPYHTFLQDNL